MEKTYLTNMPQDANNYGLNKLLIVRDLAIDYKHRETEMFLRSPHLLEKIAPRFNLAEIMQIRAMQNRFIYHIMRNSFDTVEPDLLKNFLAFFRKNHFLGFKNNANVFIDYMAIVSGKITNPELIKNSVLFSFKSNQRAMINYFIKNNMGEYLPKQFLMVQNFDELKVYLEKNISFVLYNHDSNTFSEEELIFMFLANFHVFKCHENNNFEPCSYKTDFTLPQAQEII